ncbi:MAG TPA: hypothetical protein VGO09_03525, partial [Flavisolibacter sp.]|nr:hypothetical protein [Flavisolibacter sp.]
MKKKIGLPLLLISLAFASCSKSHNDASTPLTNQTTNSIASNVSAGTWTITIFNQKTEDKTSLFNGYIFSFLSGGVLKAEKNGVT